MQIQIFNVHIANRIALVDNSTFVLYFQEEPVGKRPAFSATSWLTHPARGGVARRQPYDLLITTNARFALWTGNHGGLPLPLDR